MIRLTDAPLDSQTGIAQVQSTQAGAVVLFLGTTREFTRGRQTLTLVYDGYREMAERELQRLETTASERWSLTACLIEHRLGEVPLGEASVLVAVSSPHRKDAFEAAQWIMDTLKQDVPIWKQEHWADGQVEWVHPGLPPTE